MNANPFSLELNKRFMRFYIDNVRPKPAPLPPGISPERAEWVLSRRKYGDWTGTEKERSLQWATWLRQFARLERRKYAWHFLQQRRAILRA